MKKLIILFFTIFPVVLNAQTKGIIGLYKAYFFDLGQDLSKPISDVKYSLIKKGKEVDIVKVDTSDVFHSVVRYKGKEGIIHNGVLANRYVLIPFYPNIRSEYIESVVNGKPQVGMNETEIGMMLGINPNVKTDPNNPNIKRWSFSSSKIGSFEFYKGKLCNAYERGLLHETHFLYRISSVEKTEMVEGTTKKDNVGTYNGSIYEDDLIKIIWQPMRKDFSFKLLNKTGFPIKIKWDEMSFVDVDGNSKRVVNAETRKIHQNLYQPETVVSKNASFPAVAIPVPERAFIAKSYMCQEQAEDEGKPEIGKRISVLFPIEVNNSIIEYIFEFEVEDVLVKLNLALKLSKLF